MVRMAKMVLMQVLLLVLPVLVFAGPMPDTGQIKCYDNSGEIPCPQPGEAFYGQDAQYAGPVRSYTKLGQNGTPLPDIATWADGWIMTRDNVTGLIWEIKTNDGSIHDRDNESIWYDAQSVFIAQLNQQGFGGYSNWRMPTIKELSSLVNSSIPSPGPTIDTSWFPNAMSSSYWSSTTWAHFTNYAWRVGFNNGSVYIANESYSYYVRAVRAGQ